MSNVRAPTYIFTVAGYHQLAAGGIFGEEDRVESLSPLAFPEVVISIDEIVP